MFSFKIILQTILYEMKRTHRKVRPEVGNKLLLVERLADFSSIGDVSGSEF